MVRRLYSGAVVLFFLVMMFYLGRDHVLPSFRRAAGIDVDRAVLVDSWVNQDDYNYLFLDKTRLGAMRSTAEEILTNDTTSGGTEASVGYSTSAHLEVKTIFFRGRVILSTRLNRRLELESARLRAHLPSLGVPLYTPEELDAPKLPAGAYELIARVDGREMQIRLRRDAAVQFTGIPLSKPVTMADSLTPVLRDGMLSRNVTYSADVYEPIWGGSAGQTQIEWIDSEEKIDAQGNKQNYRKIEMRFGNTRSLMTVSPSGVVVRRELPLFAANQSTPGALPLGGSKLIMERQEPTIATSEFPALTYVPEPPVLTDEDFKGESNGQVLDMNMFGMLAGSLGK